MKNELFNMDCIELMKSIEPESIDLLLTDPPYGITQCHWDVPLQMDLVWPEIRRVVKPNGAIIMFSIQPFTTDLINSNRKMFKYEIIWKKTQKVGFLNAKKMPLRAHENILIFYRRLPTYNPLKATIAHVTDGRKRINHNCKTAYGIAYGPINKETAESYSWSETGERYPSDVVTFSNWNGALFGNRQNATKHPTQKPVELLEYLIKTYSNEGDTVLDICAGSNSTGIASYNTNRNYIGSEKDLEIYRVAYKRTEAHKNQMEAAGKE